MQQQKIECSEFGIRIKNSSHKHIPQSKKYKRRINHTKYHSATKNTTQNILLTLRKNTRYVVESQNYNKETRIKERIKPMGQIRGMALINISPVKNNT